MKKLLLLSAVLFGTVAASQAGGVQFGFNLPFPPIPLPDRVIISNDRGYVERDRYCAPAPVYVEPYCAPQPRVVYVPQPRCYSYPTYRGYSSSGRYDGHSSHRSHGNSHHGGHSSHR